MKYEYPVIDMAATGRRIQAECAGRGYSARMIQELFGIGSIQSVYNWFKGKQIPSLDNMLALSWLLGMPIEELVICKNAPPAA